LLPWVPVPRPVTGGAQMGPLTAYVSDAAAIIGTRIDALADSAVRLRQPWTTALGPQPADAERACEWFRHVAVVAAYRDQHKVTSADPRQVLGPYAEAGHAGHKAYWHAAESVLAARQLAGLEPASDTSPDSRATAQLAADIYRNLSDDERAVITELITAAPDPASFGDPRELDERAAARPAYARPMTSVLTRRGHLTGKADYLPGHRPAESTEPVEAGLARRAWRGPGKPRRPEDLRAEPVTQVPQRALPQDPSPTVGPAPRR